LTFDQAEIEFVDVSPDGRQLLFSSDRAGNKDLWLMPVEGGEPQQLTTDPTPDWGPQWSPDGKNVAFYSYRSGNRDIWIMPVSGGPARQVTQHEDWDSHPNWSPDGRELAFVSGRRGNWDIWVIPAEGGEAQQWTDHPALDGVPTWSPDGERVFFASYRTGKGLLWQMSRENREPEPISQGPGSGHSLALAGECIYFIGGDERSGNLWELSTTEGTERSVTDLSGRNGSTSSGIATDGKYLYFTWQESLGDIWVMDVVYE
jgi:TolB protein